MTKTGSVTHAVTYFFRDLRIYVALIGVIMSLVFHELLHAALHWGAIQSVKLFPSPVSIVEIIVQVPDGYDVALEEVAAYCITAGVLLSTLIFIWWLSDTKNKHSFSQTVLPHWSELHSLGHSELLELAQRTLR